MPGSTGGASSAAGSEATARSAADAATADTAWQPLPDMATAKTQWGAAPDFSGPAVGNLAQGAAIAKTEWGPAPDLGAPKTDWDAQPSVGVPKTDWGPPAGWHSAPEGHEAPSPRPPPAPGPSAPQPAPRGWGPQPIAPAVAYYPPPGAYPVPGAYPQPGWYPPPAAYPPPGYYPQPAYGYPQTYGPAAAGVQYDARGMPLPRALGAVGGSVQPGWKYGFLALYGIAFFLAIGAIVVLAGTSGYGYSRRSSEDTGAALLLGAFVALLLMAVPALVWLGTSWAFVPAGARYTRTGRWVSPGEAVGFLFIPYFNLYWQFVANMGLCEALDNVLVAQGSAVRAPRGTAMAAGIAQCIPFLNFFAPIVWFAYMVQADRAKAAALEGVKDAAEYF